MGNGGTGKKRKGRILRFFSSMKFGMILLALLALYSTLGTLLPQGNLPGFYEENYSETLVRFIEVFQLSDVYHSIYFMVLTMLLSVNLFFCSIRRLPSAIRQYRKSEVFESDLLQRKNTEIETVSTQDPRKFLTNLGFRKTEEVILEEKKIWYGVRRRAGYFGSFIVHLGLLVVIVAFAAGKIWGYETYVRGIPGDELFMEDTEYHMDLNDFDIEYRSDYSIHQYISTVDYKSSEGEILKSEEISVNDPMRVKGYKVYQSGTGWMMNIIVNKEEEEIRRERFYQSGILFLEEENLAIEFRNFYPDFLLSDGKIYTRTPFLNNPRYLFTLYENGESVYMNVASIGETVTYKGISFQAFEPRLYTVLQVVKDPGAIFAGIGGVMMLLGLLLTFYYVPQHIIFEEQEAGWLLHGDTPKNKEAFRLYLEEKLEEHKTKGGEK
ncbi:cytochrome c biogenesis protein ResB [Proteiniclasticum sp. C24MP]|uniref:cytochrome c biogenesis protein ResB n=1 Tax=Proteiniclasticum sp. C24MP TaxID=3374101 RepID=UPI0037542983